MSDEYIKLAEDFASWWDKYLEYMLPRERLEVTSNDLEEMVLRWADYNEIDLGCFDLEILMNTIIAINGFNL